MKIKFKLTHEPDPFKDQPTLVHSLELRLTPPASDQQKVRAVAKKLGVVVEEVFLDD